MVTECTVQNLVMPQFQGCSCEIEEWTDRRRASSILAEDPEDSCTLYTHVHWLALWQNEWSNGCQAQVSPAVTSSESRRLRSPLSLLQCDSVRHSLWWLARSFFLHFWKVSQVISWTVQTQDIETVTRQVSISKYHKISNWLQDGRVLPCFASTQRNWTPRLRTWQSRKHDFGFLDFEHSKPNLRGTYSNTQNKHHWREKRHEILLSLSWNQEDCFSILCRAWSLCCPHFVRLWAVA